MKEWLILNIKTNIFDSGFFDINGTTKAFRVARVYSALKKEIKLIATATILFIYANMIQIVYRHPNKKMS